MKCLVTGGAGFIGSNLAEELLNQGNGVTIIDDLSTGSYKNIEHFKNKVSFIRGSILDLNLLQKNFKNCDLVFHEAAIPSVTRSIVNPKLTSEVNIQGSLNVLLAARDNKVRRVVYASSSSIYGDTKELPKIEAMNPNPKSPYALAKFVGEQYCRMFAYYYSLDTVCLRYFNVFGPRQNPDSEYAAVIPKFISCLLRNKSPTIYGDGNQTRDFTYVKDVVKANILAAGSNVKDGTIMNIAYNQNISINSLLGLINKILGTKIKATYQKPREGDIKDSLAGISKAQELIGYEPDYNLESGLRETIEWFKDNQYP